MTRFMLTTLLLCKERWQREDHKTGEDTDYENRSNKLITWTKGDSPFKAYNIVDLDK